MERREASKYLQRMSRDWDRRARENARFYVATGQENWSEEEFFRSGEATVQQQILNDLTNVCQGKAPNDMTVLEIGCGAGRITRALAGVFGQVFAVDISREMIRQARQALSACPNVRLFRNNGKDLSAIRNHWWERFGLGKRPRVDFAFSCIVFQHIPSREIIENYVLEVNRLLRPGGLFKFQVQGREVPPEDLDTWTGVHFDRTSALEMAERCGFEMRYDIYDATLGGQYYWLWFFKNRDVR